MGEVKREVKKKSKWKEVDRKCLGLYMSGPCRGPGWGNPGYYNAIYNVVEYNGEEWRNRVVDGPVLRDYTEGYDALVSLYTIFLNRALKAEEGK